MGMCLGLCSLAAADVEKVLADPPLIWKVVAPEDPEAYQAEVAARAGRPGLLARLLGRGPAAPPRAPEALDAGEIASTDLDKAWHGIHFLLTGTDWGGEGPAAFLVRGGREAAGVDVGYGPARLFTAAEVRDVAAALAPLDEAALRDRFDPEAMTRLDIYPSIWSRDPEDDDALGYCLEYFDVLREFVSDCAARGRGLVVYVS